MGRGRPNVGEKYIYIHMVKHTLSISEWFGGFPTNLIPGNQSQLPASLSQTLPRKEFIDFIGSLWIAILCTPLEGIWKGLLFVYIDHLFYRRYGDSRSSGGCWCSWMFALKTSQSRVRWMPSGVVDFQGFFSQSSASCLHNMFVVWTMITSPLYPLWSWATNPSLQKNAPTSAVWCWFPVRLGWQRSSDLPCSIVFLLLSFRLVWPWCAWFSLWPESGRALFFYMLWCSSTWFAEGLV